MYNSCLSCKKPNIDDSITSDGLCFDCDAEKIDFVIERECFDGIVEKLAIAQSLEPGKKVSN